MNIFFTVIIVVQVLSALTIIGLVLLQHGKGADMGAAFGSGASGSLFGASGSSNFLSKATGVAATIFFCATLALAYVGSKPGALKGGVMEGLPAVPAASSVVPTPAQSATTGDAQSAAPAATPAANAPAPAVPANQIPK
ncbi:preprotein translocase subunit SecG [Noviherbaspirillum sedimenti]|uniref:Protein-export membrane protein SecG n=1 Tax=Noviherbaspirillum sedimenti TaxID=2320865 RepID=A0A3A3G2S0_9BURK|nr:preprotein translocase subunit SecG [Noviherbaspirillum sedimenti]RJG00782.1 preprotein translocase subunit SecG [Noviherbaspirillum sedimenti]